MTQTALSELNQSLSAVDAITGRRAVKHYDPAATIPADIERHMLELASLAPSSFNQQHWRFVLVRDASLRAAIRAAAWDQAQVTEASLLVVLCADVNAWAKEPQRYWKDAPDAVREMLAPMISPFYVDNPQLQRDEAMRSVGLAAQTLMLAAKAYGYDSCPMIGFDAAKVGELIHLPEDHVIGMLITIGKALKPAWPKPGQLALDDIIIENHF